MIYIIRHGQTEQNKLHRLLGRSDYPMNENGIGQAQKAAALLRQKGVCFDAVYSSPLLRARETAEILAPDVPLTVDERLIEMDYGPYEGMDLLRPAIAVIPFFLDFAHTPAPKGMESLDSVLERTGEFMKTLSGREETILVSTHAIAMKGILENLTPASKGRYWSKRLGNCEIYTTEWTENGFSVPSLWSQS